jgi:DNA-binding XRE family transcriptional regulator
METAELLTLMKGLAEVLPPSIKHDLSMVMHKLTYPMRDILEQVPAASLTERAKKLKVSRQTLYVWASEKYRPTLKQAKIIAKLSGVPIEHIVDDGFEEGYDARRKARKKVARVAKGSRKTPKRDRGVAPKRRSEGVARKRARAAE